jgi:tRNA-splicing ligase RtcB (3'-phosphate/5'-hydroxy nucleic acid ligase)
VKYTDTERVVIKSWCNAPEGNALAQARNLANLPFVFRQVCLMPDTHEGYGMPIGGVIATEGVVIPNAVGVDIGCGMLAIQTSLLEIDLPTLKRVIGIMRNTIPVGFNHHKESQDESLMPQQDDPALYPEVNRQYQSACKQIGTLGGGNHFIEVQKGSDGHIWFMIHSGSRNLGLKVANRHNRIANDLNERWHVAVPPKWELAFLPLDTEEAAVYLREMRYCLEFALANRRLMASRVCDAFRDEIPNVTFRDAINIHHNYAAMEHHFGQNVLVHRKGATSAREGEMGIIPGSQGSCSYIVRGKGNQDSFMSCSHGAGRKMGRQAAIRNLDLEAEVKALEEKGILHALRGKKDLEEAAGAYKDIDVVMEEQQDLVDIVARLEPLAVIKG